MLAENSVVLIGLMTDRGSWDSVAANLFIPIDSPFQKLQNRIFFKFSEHWPPEKSFAQYSPSMILSFFGSYFVNFSQKVSVRVETNNRFGISIEN